MLLHTNTKYTVIKRGSERAGVMWHQRRLSVKKFEKINKNQMKKEKPALAYLLIIIT
jgi:hypothetical protein